MTWRLAAACRGVDPDLFFPHRGEQTSTPKSVCVRCPVRQECLDWALENHELHGVWGGLSGKERRAYRRASLRSGGSLTLSAFAS